MQKVALTLEILLNQLPEISVEEDNEELEDAATKWVKDILESKKVNFIPLDDLKCEESLDKGGFGYITKAIWTRKNKYVVYKRLIDKTALKHRPLDAFIHELKIHLHLLNYSDRIIRCWGISQGNLAYFFI